jgi:2-C-methyl-D-erythritol 2,4-cyclodiphosphate synthase
MRAGTGYDLHRLVEGRRLVLGGVTLEHTKGLLGHSDADVVVHAVIDALLGAGALGNIGQHFPDTDPRFKDADSVALLTETARMLREAGYAVSNIDVTVVAEEPKLGPHINRMRSNLARATGIDMGSVSVKAKTNEKAGPEGRGEAISAQAIALIESPG